ncbi:protein of unknown function [Xenorhabdus nematophila AN6/1]|nr:hypothetical protein LH67_09245 [Xenorhabdus nematophila]CEE92291.1 hypothetical protein XNA1_2740004 [Xenorhabdus nematophila str. Anatoliense]CEE93873.1 hypothetical protein XNA1_440004 [Xenorhabdus nematophila str. Anatoliense]CEF30834.1 hypothetical protein XNW1_2850061 [Xenorhabdus nematophila str. Websteri]CEK22057.1 protein of unknown function [Xenorhabdus nematophila AN6/1]
MTNLGQQILSNWIIVNWSYQFKVQGLKVTKYSPAVYKDLEPNHKNLQILTNYFKFYQKIITKRDFKVGQFDRI